MAKAEKVRDILEAEKTVDERVKALAEQIQIRNLKLLKQDSEKDSIDKQRIEAIEHRDEKEAERKKSK